MIQPLISVIIPLYNKEKWVRRSVESVSTQTYTHIEIVIVNDGSTDNSLEVVATIVDPRLRIISQSNGGVSSARNLGLDNAKGDYIAFLDADDEWEPRHLEVLAKGFEHFGEAIVICDDLIELKSDESKREKHRRKTPFAIKQNEGKEEHYFPIEAYLQTLGDDYFILSGSSVLIKSSVIKAYQVYFHENMTHGEDVNYWIQLSRYGKFVFCDYLGVIYHRGDAQSAMSRRARQAQLTPDYFYKLPIERFHRKEQADSLRFLRREYYKKAYQNRGLPLDRKEFSGKIGAIKIGYFSVWVYVAIRFCPSSVFVLLKKIKSF